MAAIGLGFDYEPGTVGLRLWYRFDITIFMEVLSFYPAEVIWNIRHSMERRIFGVWGYGVSSGS